MREIGWRLFRRLLGAPGADQRRADLGELYAKTTAARGPWRARVRYARELILILGWGLWSRRAGRSSSRKSAGGAERMLQDVRYALRALSASPGFTFIAVLALALGIGFTSAVFGIIDAALLRPLPYERPEALVVVQEQLEGTPSPAHFLAWRDRTAAFEAIAAFTGSTVNLTGEG